MDFLLVCVEFTCAMMLVMFVVRPLLWSWSNFLASGDGEPKQVRVALRRALITTAVAAALVALSMGFVLGYDRAFVNMHDMAASLRHGVPPWSPGHAYHVRIVTTFVAFGLALGFYLLAGVVWLLDRRLSRLEAGGS